MTNFQEYPMKPTEIVMAYAEALGKGDMLTAFSFFNQKASWHQPGEHQFAGIKNGIDEIGKMLTNMMVATKGTFIVKLNGKLMANDHLVVMPVRFTGSIGERKIDMPGLDLFEVKEGKITGVWLFSGDQEVEDRFWGK